MKNLIKDLIKPFINEENLQPTVGVFGGGFQPPTKGHLEVIKQALDRYPLLDTFIIFVGTGGGRSNITQEQSIKIWNIYKKLLPSKVQILPSNNPISSIYSYVRENPQTKIKWFLGSREDKEDDFIQFNKRTTASDKPNLEIINIITKEPASGTAARKSLDNKQLFFSFLPSGLSLSDKEEIYNIIQNPITELVPNLDINQIDDYDNENELVTTDLDTNINIPLVDKSNTNVVKSTISKKNFNTHDSELAPREEFFQPIYDKKPSFNKIEYYKKYYTNLSPSDFKIETKDDKILISNISKNELKSNTEFKDNLISLISHMIKSGLNIEPLPNLIFIEDDVENSNKMLGTTAYYNIMDQSITLFTLNRHPKDILRSFSHEMIHHIQNLENRLINIHTQDINEDEYLAELELEAYSQGNMIFRSWENSLKTSINEWIIDTPKYSHTPELSNKLFFQIHELKINEINLSPDNAVEINGDLFDGEFKVGDIEYIYSIDNMDSPYSDGGEFYSIAFDEKNNNSRNIPTGNAKENYIKILSTMYKIILDFAQSQKPEYIGISSLDKSGYWSIYNSLIKTNKLPGYSRKEAGLNFNTKSGGGKGKFIVLKRND